MSYKLQTSGDLRLIHSPQGIVSFPEKGLLILALLLAGGDGSCTRARVARLLWGGIDPSRALTNLRQTIARIVARQEELGTSFLLFDATHVRLAPDALTSDLNLIFALETAPESELRARLGRAMTHYRLPFLGDLTSQTPELDSWILETQRRLADLFTRSIQIALPLCSTAQDVILLREAAMRVFRADPGNRVIQDILARLGSEDGATPSVPSVLPGNGSETASPDGGPGIGLESSLTHVSGALDIVRTLYARQQFPQPRSAEGPLALRPPQELSVVPRVAILPPVEDDPLGVVSALLEDVTISLCSSRRLRIVAPYTAARISRHENKPQLIIQHAIAYALDTRLTHAGGRTSLFAQLIYVASDEVVWAERFPVDEANFLVQRHEIARRVASGVSEQVERNEISRLYFEDNPQAYFHYLHGQGYLQHLTLPEIRKARKSFRAALQEKPDFGPALSGLARTNHLEWLVTARGEPELLHAAERHAMQAIERCGDLTFGYRELGVTKLFLGGFDDSVEALLTAEKLSPQYADVIADFGDTLIHASRPAEGLAKLERAIELNPVTPDGYLWAAAGASYYLEDYFGALAYIARMDDQTPAVRLAAACNAMVGDMRQAKQLSRKVRQQHPGFDVDTWISVLPIREQWQREHYRQGLKKAGL